MKHILSTAAITALLATAAQADLTRVEAGLGSWSVTPSGDLTYNTGATNEKIDVKDDLGLDSQSMSYAWIYLKHPVPVVPNVRLEYSNIDVDGSSTQTFTWGGLNYDAQTQSALKIQQYDVGLYYNIFDNTFWTTIDLGLNIKFADMKFDFRETTGTLDSYNESGSLTLPMAYLRGRFEVPATDLVIEADIKYIGFAGSSISDMRIKADYTLSMIPVIQPGIEVGYRVQQFKIDDSSVDVKTDISFSGVYAGLMVRF